jgi:hypothetical protein
MLPATSRHEFELRLTIAPPPAAIIPGATAWIAKNMWRRMYAIRSTRSSLAEACALTLA